MKDKGFSLIELMVVFAIIVLAISLVIPSLSHFSKTIELKAAVKKVSGILRYCRSEAVNKGLVYQVLFNSDLREVKVQSMPLTDEKGEEEKKEETTLKKTYSLPDGVEMKEVDFASPQYPSDLPAVEFYPNGGSNGGSVLFDSRDRKGFRIKIHFLTGMVEVERV